MVQLSVAYDGASANFNVPSDKRVFDVPNGGATFNGTPVSVEAIRMGEIGLPTNPFSTAPPLPPPALRPGPAVALKAPPRFGSLLLWRRDDPTRCNQRATNR